MDSPIDRQGPNVPPAHGAVSPSSQAPFVVSFVGPSGVGKTTVIEQLVGLLRERSLRVGTVKHAPHGFDVVDRVGSDSWRHRAAGADAVLLAGAGGAVLFLAESGDRTGVGHDRSRREGVNTVAELVTSHLGHVDVVLAEGFAPLHDALVEVRRAAVPPKDSVMSSAPWAVVTDHPHEPDEFSFDDLAGVADRIAAELPRRGS